VNKVPFGRYIAFVGSLLVAILFFADWYLPMAPTQSVTSPEADKPVRHGRQEGIGGFLVCKMLALPNAANVGVIYDPSGFSFTGRSTPGALAD
jgi:hypothetical protein